MAAQARADLGEIARVLVLVQGAILIMSALESRIAASGFGLAPPATILTGASAIVTLAAAAGLGRRAAWARRFTLFYEGFVLTTAAFDLILAVLMTGTVLGLMPTLTRVAIPLAVWKLLRRPEVRTQFSEPSALIGEDSRT